MYTKITYKGYVNSVYGIYCGFKPEGLEVEQEVTVYYPDEGMIFKKDEEQYDVVILQAGELIDEYIEVPYVEPEPEEIIDEVE